MGSGQGRHSTVGQGDIENGIQGQWRGNWRDREEVRGPTISCNHCVSPFIFLGVSRKGYRWDLNACECVSQDTHRNTNMDFLHREQENLKFYWFLSFFSKLQKVHIRNSLVMSSHDLPVIHCGLGLPVTPPSAYAMPIPGSRPRGPRISLGKSPSGATPGTALFLATLMSFAGVMGGILLLSTKE